MKKHFLKSFALLAMLFSAISINAESAWCNRVIGYLDPNGVGNSDDKSYVRLTVQDNQDGTISFIVAADPTLPKAAPDVDYVLINPGIGTAGDDATALESQVVKYSVPAGTEKLTVEILWSYSNWEGRYMVQNLEIPLSEICGASDSGEGGEDPEEPEVTDKWASLNWLGNGSGLPEYTEKYKISHNCLKEVVNIQQPGFASEVGIYVTTNGDIESCSVNGDIQGGGMVLHLSSFTAKETEVTINYAGGSCTFVVYYADGTEGGGDGLIVTEYCDYTDANLTKNGAAIALTWETADNGDVVITMDNGIGAESCSYRNGGFEGGIEAFVVSTDNFATTTQASDYFTFEKVYSGNEARLVNIANLPKGAKIKHIGAGHALAWTVNGNNEYCFPDFIYTYGGVCNNLDAPTNVAVTDAGVLTFDEVVGANAYEVHVYQGTTLKHTQNIVNGGTINFEVYVAGTYIVKVIAKGEGKGDSSESDPASWNMQASPLPGSNYCETLVDRIKEDRGGYCSPLFTWITDDSGNVVITVSASEGEEGETKFRGVGMSGDGFSLDGSVDNFNTYFNRGKTDDYTYTLTLKDAANKPTLGSVISFSGQIEAASSIHTNDWSIYEFDGYLYGTKCAGGYQVGATPADPAMGSAIVKQNGVEVTSVEGGTVQFIATPAEGYVFVNWTKGGEVVSTSATYEMEITATTRLIANFDYIRTIYCQTPVQTSAGNTIYLTVGQATTEGKYQIKIEGTSSLTITGINNANTAMNCIKFTGKDAENNPINYDGNDVPFTKNNGGWIFSDEGYGVITSAEFEPSTDHTWKDMWMWRPDLYFKTSLSAEENINSILDDRFDWSNKCEDTEKPQMGTATLLSNTQDEAIIEVSATDNKIVVSYHVVDATNSYNQILSPTEGKITLTGLTANTAYTFTITAIDLAGNESENSVDVACTTSAITYVVSATPSDPAMGAAVVKQNGVEVTSVNADSEVVFTATPNEGSTFVNWTKEGVEISTSATYETTITSDLNLVANFDYIRTIYCQTPVQTSAGNTIYLTVGQATTEGKYQIKIEGTSSLTITGINNANTAMNCIKFTGKDAENNPINYDGNDVPFTKNNGGWIFSDEGYGVITSAEFEPSTDHTWKDMWMWRPDLYFKTSLSAEENINSILDDRFDWSNTCEDDTQKPSMGTAELVSQSHNTATIAVTATDNRLVYSYHVVSTTPAHDQTIEPIDGNITVTNLTANTDYTFTITAIDLAGNESENYATVSVKTNAYIAEPSSLPTAPTWPANQVQAVYSETYDANCEFGEWGSGTQYTQDTYGKKYVTAAGGYFGLTGFKLNCSKMETLHMDIWCADPISLGIVPIYKENQGGNEDKRVTKSIAGGQWNSIEIPLADFVGVPSWNNVHQIKIDNVSNQTLWINNVYFYTTQAPTETEAPINITATATPSFETAVISCSATDESGSVKFRVMLGDEPKGTGNANSGETTNITVTNLQAGRTFTLQVYASDVYGNEAVEPIEVNFTTNPYPEPAPTPMWAAENVKSIYSESYASAFTSLNSYNEGWWNAPQMLDAAIAPDNHALYYYGFADGMIGWQFAAFDATGYTTFTMDIYPMNDGTIDFGPLNEAPANDYAITGIPVKGGQWNTITIDLRDKDLTKIFQVKMINYYSLGAFFIDNVYLYKIVIDENTDLTKLANGLECDVTLKRNFVMDGDWNTISLPFALDADQVKDVFGEGTTLVELRNSNLLSETEIDLEFAPVTAMAAATPYLIKPEKNVDTGTLVNDVTINVSPKTIETTSAHMIPVLKTEDFTGEDNTFFLGTNCDLWNKSADGKIKGMRAYFKIIGLDPEQLRNVRARVVFGENETTGLDNITNNEAPAKMIQNGQLIIIRNGVKYNVQGQKL